MVYPTPGFVVRQTFLEFEDPDSDQPQATLRQRGRALSDTDLSCKAKHESQFGSEELRIYCLGNDAPEEPPRRPLALERLRPLPAAGRPAADTASDGSLRLFGSELLEAHAEVVEPPAVETNVESDASVPDVALSPREEARSADVGLASGFHAASAGMTTEPAELAAELAANRTTVVLSELPLEYNRYLLAEALDAEGFQGRYDFIYLPMDLRTRTSNGFALVNMRIHEDAMAVMRHFDGFGRWQAPSSQACVTSWSRFCQGLDELVERYRNSPVMHEAVADMYKPVVFEDGLPAPFPAPTKRLRMPRLRKLGKERSKAPGVYASTASVGDGGSGGSVASEAAGGATPSAASVAAEHTGGQAARSMMPGISAGLLGLASDVWFVDLIATQPSCGTLPPGLPSIVGAASAPTAGLAAVAQLPLPMVTQTPTAMGVARENLDVLPLAPTAPPALVPAWYANVVSGPGAIHTGAFPAGCAPPTGVACRRNRRGGAKNSAKGNGRRKQQPVTFAA